MSYLNKRLEKRLKDPEFKKAWEESEKEYQKERTAILKGMNKAEKSMNQRLLDDLE